MQRIDVIRAIVKELGTYDKNMGDVFQKFYTENKHLDDREFYKAFSHQFYWADYLLQKKQRKNIRIITNCLIFFVVIASLSFIIGLVLAISSSSM
jgi:hypothetical protein